MLYQYIIKYFNFAHVRRLTTAEHIPCTYVKSVACTLISVETCLGDAYSLYQCKILL